MTKRISIFLYIIIVLSLFSCKERRNTLLDSQYTTEVRVNTDEYIMPTKENFFLRNYNMLSSSGDIVVAYNYRVHALDIFNQSDYLAQIELKTEGGDGILQDIQGLHFHTWDSIWIYNHGIIYLTDTTCSVKKKINIGNLQDEEIIIHSNYSISRINLYYNKEKKSLFYSTRIISDIDNPQFNVYEYVLETGDIKKYELSSSYYDTDIMSMYGWKNSPNITFSDTKIIYNYPIESNIYTINLNDKSKQIYGGKSKFTANVAERLTKNTEILDAEKHKIENIHFFEMVYNPSLNLYFRLHVDKNEYFPNKDAFVQFNEKDLYLTIFNNKFEILSETKLRSNRYSIITSWCPVNDGLLLFVNNHFSETTSKEDVILFDIIKPQKK